MVILEQMGMTIILLLSICIGFDTIDSALCKRKEA